MTALAPGALWGEVAVTAGMRVHRIEGADERYVTLVEVRSANGTQRSREKRTRLARSRFVRCYAPVEDAPLTRTPLPEAP